MSLFDTVIKLTKPISDIDTALPSELMLYIMEEMGELAQEVSSAYCNTYKKPDEGVVAEAVDLIVGILYMLKRVSPDLTEADLIAIATKKIGKWQAKETAYIAEQLVIESAYCAARQRQLTEVSHVYNIKK